MVQPVTYGSFGQLLCTSQAGCGPFIYALLSQRVDANAGRFIFLESLFLAHCFWIETRQRLPFLSGGTKGTKMV